MNGEGDGPGGLPLATASRYSRDGVLLRAAGFFSDAPRQGRAPAARKSNPANTRFKVMRVKTRCKVPPVPEHNRPAPAAYLPQIADQSTTSATMGRWSEPVAAPRVKCSTVTREFTSAWSIWIAAGGRNEGQVACQPNPSAAERSPPIDQQLLEPGARMG